MQANVVQDQDFYLPMEQFQSRIVRIEDTLFRIHQHRLIEASLADGFFHDLFMNQWPLTADGADAATPIVLHPPGSVAAFKAFLKVIYQSGQEGFRLTPAEWLGAMEIAYAYNCPTIHELAYRHLTTGHNLSHESAGVSDAVRLLALAEERGLDMGYFRNGALQLVVRRKAQPSEAEMGMISPHLLHQIIQMREYLILRGHRARDRVVTRSTANKLEAAEIRSILSYDRTAITVWPEPKPDMQGYRVWFKFVRHER
ncbi:hypothetical protein PENSPDRAFT_656193 [Peniophora sp. CONT]|nr:hypothetical protein PENSPDRAFT_656193 [Peniophora sp. CONT]